MITYKTQTTLVIAEKQNIVVKSANSKVHQRQGKGFRLDLGINNGPFLPKDVTPLNQKSRYLLAARQVLDSHICMSSLLQQLQAKQKYMMKSLPSCLPKEHKIQNFTAQFCFIDVEISNLKQQSKKLSIEETKLKKQMRACYEKFTNINQQVIDMCTPIFKNLLKTVRNHHELQKNCFQESRKNIESLVKFRGDFLEKIAGCQNSMIKMEQFLGIETLQQTEEQNDGLLTNKE